MLCVTKLYKQANMASIFQLYF